MNKKTRHKILQNPLDDFGEGPLEAQINTDIDEQLRYQAIIEEFVQRRSGASKRGDVQ